MIMKEERESKDTRSILISFAVGGLVGAGVALLLAPKAGKELRKDITDMAAETRNKIVATVEKGKELYGEGTEAVKHVFEAGKTAYVAEMEKLGKAA
jgi:gas vesicle protein